MAELGWLRATNRYVKFIVPWKLPFIGHTQSKNVQSKHGKSYPDVHLFLCSTCKQALQNVLTSLFNPFWMVLKKSYSPFRSVSHVTRLDVAVESKQRSMLCDSSTSAPLLIDFIKKLVALFKQRKRKGKGSASELSKLGQIRSPNKYLISFQLLRASYTFCGSQSLQEACYKIAF